MSKASLAEVANAAHIFLHNQSKIDGLREAIATHDAATAEEAEDTTKAKTKPARKAKAKA